MGKLSIDFNDFQRDFRNKIRDPLVEKLTPKLSQLPSDSDIKKLIERFLDALEDLLPKYLYSIITEQESRNVSGAEKYITVVELLTRKLKSIGIPWAAPILIPIVESVVRMVYRNSVESYFDKFGLEDAFERWLGFSVDSGDPATEPPTNFGSSDTELDYEE